jgi:Transmembrane protein of unknown function (DUF3556)
MCQNELHADTIGIAQSHITVRSRSGRDDLRGVQVRHSEGGEPILGLRDIMRSKRIKRAMYRNYRDDIRPSRLAVIAAHAATVIEYTVPLLLVLSHGGTLTWVCLAIIIFFHLHILSTIPMGVPLEWNVFFIFSALFLFGHYASVSVASIGSPLLVALLLATVIAMPVIGNLRPDLVSFLPAMRYYAGNWATSLWCFRKGSEAKLDVHLKKTAPIISKQLSKLYGEDVAELMQQKVLAWRSMHTHGRALNGLPPRAVDNMEDYDIREGSSSPMWPWAGTSVTVTSTMNICLPPSRTSASSSRARCG